jgi:hypothetical protein
MSAYSAAILNLTNLISNWRFGESAGTVAEDEKFTNHGTYAGGFTLGVTGAIPADTNTAVTFNGTTGKVTVLDSASLDFANGPFTWIIWVKRADAISASFQMMYAKGTQGNLYFNLNLIHFDNNSTDIVRSSNTITDTASWHMVALTRSGTGTGNTKLYWDGADVTVEVNPGNNLSSNAVDLRFGTYTDDSLDLNGSIDEYALVGRVLTGAEILGLYTLGITPAAPVQPSGTTTLTQYRNALYTVLTDEQTASPTILRKVHRWRPGGVNEAPEAWVGDIATVMNIDAGTRTREASGQIIVAAHYPTDLITSADPFDQLQTELIDRFSLTATATMVSPNSILELIGIEESDVDLVGADTTTHYRGLTLTTRLRIWEGRD